MRLLAISKSKMWLQNIKTFYFTQINEQKQSKKIHAPTSSKKYLTKAWEVPNIFSSTQNQEKDSLQLQGIQKKKTEILRCILKTERKKKSHLHMLLKQKNGKELLFFHKKLQRSRRNKRLLSLLLCGLFPVKRAICGHKGAKHLKTETLTWKRH